MTEAAKLVHLSNDRLGRLLKYYLIDNGVRVYNTAKNNKGILICKDDLEAIKKCATDEGIRLIDVQLI